MWKRKFLPWMRMERVMNFKEEQKEKVEKIEAILREYLPEANGYQSVIMEAMEYSLMAGGKRLRPMLMMETYRLFGGETEVIYPFMAAMEMIHTYSLVHDDLPAMDNDEYRRGRKTTHIVYGEDMGILAGDALLNYAFETACKAFEQFPEESLRIGQAMRVLARKAGIYGMIGGQVVDVKESGHQIDEEVLDFISRLKTGALIESAMMIGAILAGASKEDVKSMQKVAGKIGMAFQIQDVIDSLGQQVDLAPFEGGLLLLEAVIRNDLEVDGFLCHPAKCQGCDPIVPDDADLPAVQGSGILRGNGVVAGLMEQIILIRAHSGVGEEHGRGPLFGVGHAAETVDLALLKLMKQFRPAAVDILVFPAGVIGDLLEEVITVAAFYLAVRRAFLEHIALIPADADLFPGERLRRGSLW